MAELEDSCDHEGAHIDADELLLDLLRLLAPDNEIVGEIIAIYDGPGFAKWYA